jgi:hypothetical protein
VTKTCPQFWLFFISKKGQKKKISIVDNSANLVTLLEKRRNEIERLRLDQGDQIVKIFAKWLIVYFGMFFGKLTKVANHVLVIFPLSRLRINTVQKWVGLHFGRFFHELIRSPWA